MAEKRRISSILRGSSSGIPRTIWNCILHSRKGFINNRLSATRYIKVTSMGLTEILRRIWLFSANKITESFSKQPYQFIVELNLSLRHIIASIWFYEFQILDCIQLYLFWLSSPEIALRIMKMPSNQTGLTPNGSLEMVIQNLECLISCSLWQLKWY